MPVPPKGNGYHLDWRWKAAGKFLTSSLSSRVEVTTRKSFVPMGQIICHTLTMNPPPPLPHLLLSILYIYHPSLCRPFDPFTQPHILAENIDKGLLKYYLLHNDTRLGVHICSQGWWDIWWRWQRLIWPQKYGATFKEKKDEEEVYFKFKYNQILEEE